MTSDRHVFVFNPADSGSEQLMLVTTYKPNGDPGVVYAEQELSLQSYGNSASFQINGFFSPANLRKLADQLERQENLARLKVNRPEVFDKADGVSGHFGIRRRKLADSKAFEFWNKNCWSTMAELYFSRESAQRVVDETH